MGGGGRCGAIVSECFFTKDPNLKKCCFFFFFFFFLGGGGVGGRWRGRGPSVSESF